MTPSERNKFLKLGTELQTFGPLLGEANFRDNDWWASILESNSRISGLLYSLKADKSKYRRLPQARVSFTTFSAALSESRIVFDRDPTGETVRAIGDRLYPLGEQAVEDINALVGEVLRDYWRGYANFSAKGN